MGFKRIIILISIFIIVFISAELCYADDVNISVTDETREVTITGQSIQYEGTIVTISVWFPGISRHDVPKSIGAWRSLEGINAYTGQTEIKSDGTFVKKFILKEDAPSGRYTVNIFVEGDEKIRELTFDYTNVKKLAEVLESIQNATSYKEIKDALEYGIMDIHVELATSYLAFSEEEKEYIADELFGDSFENVDDLILKLSFPIQRVKILHELKSSMRGEIANIINDNYELLLISQDVMNAYRRLSTNKQEKVIVLFSGYLKDCKLPDDIQAYFKKSVEEANLSSIGDPSYPGGGSGRKPSSNTVSTKITGDLEIDLSELLVPPQEKFKDLEDVEWAKTAIYVLHDNEIINGKSDSEFSPNEPVKREEFVKMLVLGFDLTAGTYSAQFEDVAEDAWYYPFVSIAKGCSIINGISDKEFGIGLHITRQDMATLIYKAAKYKNKEFLVVREEVNYDDYGDIADYAKEAVDILTKAGIINGKGENKFDPGGIATRAEAAQIIYSALYRLNLI